MKVTLYFKRKDEKDWKLKWVNAKAKHLQGSCNNSHAQHVIFIYFFSFFLETYHIKWRLMKCSFFDKRQWLLTKHTSKAEMNVNCQLQKWTWFSQLDLLISSPEVPVICIYRTMDGKIHFRLIKTGDTATCLRSWPLRSSLSLLHQAKSY